MENTQKWLGISEFKLKNRHLNEFERTSNEFKLSLELRI